MVETLVAAAVAAVVGVALAGALAAAVRLERMSERASPAVCERMFSAMERDLSAGVVYGEHPFEGTPSSMRVLCAFRSVDPSAKVWREDLRMFRYRLADGTVVREAQKTPETAAVPDDMKKVPLLGGFDAFSFSYGVYDAETKRLRWQREFAGPGFPDAVAVQWRRGTVSAVRYLTVYRDETR